MPTRTGRPCSWRALRALSTMIIAPLRSQPVSPQPTACSSSRPRFRTEGATLGPSPKSRSPPAASSGPGQGRRSAVRPRFRACRTRPLVARLRQVFEHLIAMSEAFWNVNGAVVVGGQLDFDVLEKGRALRPQVHDDVKDAAAGASNVPRLRRRRVLEVHSSHCPAGPVEPDVRLGDHGLEPVPLELMLAKGAGEEAAVVLPRLDVHDERTAELRLRESNPSSSTRAVCRA
jgi:hypothetical protein